MAYSFDSEPSDGISLNGWITSPIAVVTKELISSMKVDFVENAGKMVYFVISKFDVYNTFIFSVDLGALNTAPSSIKLSTYIFIILPTGILSLIIKKWKKMRKSVI